jgi:hypothetical protein
MAAPPAREYAGRMLIELLGLPDEGTAALEAVLAEALAQLGLGDAATVRRVEDMGAMIARGVRQPPALRIDGRVVCRGRVPGVAEILGYLDAAQP